MPPKRKAGAGARKEATDSESDVPPKKKPCPRPKKNGPYKMPPPLPAGEVLTDYAKHSWVLGDSVGKGGFGEIYRAAPVGKSASAQHADHVIKIVRYSLPYSPMTHLALHSLCSTHTYLTHYRSHWRMDLCSLSYHFIAEQLKLKRVSPVT